MTFLPLLATLTALLCGPLLYALARHRPPVLAFLDGFVLVSIAGLVLLEAVPGAFGQGGAWSLGFLALGAVGPSLVEHGMQRARREAHLATLALAVLGLLLHSLADGAALSPAHVAHGGHGQGRDALALAIVVHSLPVGLVVWWVMRPVFGRRLPLATILLMCAGTLAGWTFGTELDGVLGARASAWFQALVAGSILHVVFGRPHLEEDSDHRDPQPPFEGLGNLVALLGLVGLARLDPHTSSLQGFAAQAGVLWMAAAPLLLAGYAFAGLAAAWRGGPALGALRFALVDAVDASAARVLGLLLLAAVLDGLLRAQGLQPWAWHPGDVAMPPWPGLLAAVLFVASLLRLGGRRWLSSVLWPGRHSH